MGVRPHDSGDKLSPQEFIVTAYYWLDGWAEEVDFIITPGTSEAAIREVAEEYASEHLDPNGWEKITFGQPSCGMVYF